MAADITEQKSRESELHSLKSKVLGIRVEERRALLRKCTTQLSSTSWAQLGASLGEQRRPQFDDASHSSARGLRISRPWRPHTGPRAALERSSPGRVRERSGCLLMLAGTESRDGPARTQCRISWT